MCGAGDNLTDVQSVKMIYLPRFTHLLPFVPSIIPSLQLHFITVFDDPFLIKPPKTQARQDYNKHNSDAATTHCQAKVQSPSLNQKF